MQNTYSPNAISPYGVKMYGMDVLQSNASVLSKIINNDHGLDENKKQSVLAMLDNPKTFNSLLSGAAGGALIRSVGNFEKMSKPAQMLVTMAGFGLGRAVYDLFHDPETFSSYNSNKDTIKIKI
jgi:hypothetical protein